jgi:hypothetical protein
VLVADGYRVRVLARPASGLRALEGCRVEVVRGDILEPDSVTAAIASCARGFHVAGDYRLWARDPGEIYRNKVDGNGTRTCVSFWQAGGTKDEARRDGLLAEDIAKASMYQGIKSPTFIGMSDARAGRPALRALPLHRLAAGRYGIAARLHAAPVGFLVDVERQQNVALVVLSDRDAKAGLLLPHAVRHDHARRGLGHGGHGRGAARQEPEGEDQAAEPDRGAARVGAHGLTEPARSLPTLPLHCVSGPVHVDLAPLEVPSLHLMRSTHERRRTGRGYRKNARVRTLIPGALHRMIEELEARQQEVPRDRDIVLYCT